MAWRHHSCFPGSSPWLPRVFDSPSQTATPAPRGGGEEGRQRGQQEDSMPLLQRPGWVFSAQDYLDLKWSASHFPWVAHLWYLLNYFNKWHGPKRSDQWWRLDRSKLCQILDFLVKTQTDRTPRTSCALHSHTQIRLFIYLFIYLAHLF